MNGEDNLPPFQVRLSDIDQPVEICLPGGEPDRPGSAGWWPPSPPHPELLQPVDLGQDLVQHGLHDMRTEVRSACGGEGIKFIEEDDRGGDLPRLFENIPRTARSLSPTHLERSWGPRIAMKFAPLSFATAFAIRVFPVPGGP